MSIDATLWAWRQQGVNPDQKLVLLALADVADHEGGVCIDNTVSRKTGISEINEVLLELDGLGFLMFGLPRKDKQMVYLNMFSLGA